MDRSRIRNDGILAFMANLYDLDVLGKYKSTEYKSREMARLRSSSFGGRGEEMEG